MSSQDDYILVTNSRNMGDDAVDQTDTTDVHDKDEEASSRSLKDRGIILDDPKERALNVGSQDTFYQELKDIGGIEILSSEEEGKGDY